MRYYLFTRPSSPPHLDKASRPQPVFRLHACGWLGGCVCRWVCGSVGRWLGGWLGGWTGGWVGGRVGRWAGGCVCWCGYGCGFWRTNASGTCFLAPANPARVRILCPETIEMSWGVGGWRIFVESLLQCRGWAILALLLHYYQKFPNVDESSRNPPNVNFFLQN